MRIDGTQDGQGQKEGLLTFAAWLERIYADRYTGPVMLHFGQGVVTEAHVLVKETRVRFDKRDGIV